MSTFNLLYIAFFIKYVNMNMFIPCFLKFVFYLITENFTNHEMVGNAVGLYPR